MPHFDTSFIDPMRWRREWAADERKRRWREVEQRFGRDFLDNLGFKGGPEFERSKQLYERLGALEAPSDISGIQDLNAAERAALIGEQELIGTQIGASQRELEQAIGRMGGGGSEAIEAAEALRVGGIGARAEAQRASILRGQERVEARRGEALRGWEAAGGGMLNLAQLREGSEQNVTAQRAAMLAAMTGYVGGGDMPYAPANEGAFSALYNAPMERPFSAETRATQLRNLYLQPTMYGRRQTGYTSPYSLSRFSWR